MSAAKPIGRACSVKEGKNRRNFLAGGSYFFPVNLAGRRLTPLDDHMTYVLQAAFRRVRARHSFTIEAAVILPDICMRSDPSQSKTRISPCVGA